MAAIKKIPGVIKTPVDPKLIEAAARLAIELARKTDLPRKLEEGARNLGIKLKSKWPL